MNRHASGYALALVLAGDYLVAVWHEAAGRLTRDAGPLEVTITGKGVATLHYRVKPPPGASAR